MRLAKICQELNIGIPTALEILTSRGYSIDCNPNAKLSDEMQVILTDRFGEKGSVEGRKVAKKAFYFDVKSAARRKRDMKESKKVVLDGVELDHGNKKFFQAVDLVKESDANVIYLTGKAGTGKTTFLKYLRQVYGGNVVVLAPTGVAAVNAQAQTIHSFFQLELTPYVPEDDRLKKINYFSTKREIIKNMSLLIIDEVSMVRCDILDAIDTILRTYRRSKSPFGGVKVLLIGDLFQLPPVVTGEVRNILKEYYNSPYFFDSKVYSNISDDKKIYFELDKPYRQKEEEFIDILNKIRVNQLNDEDLANLNKRSEIKPKGDCIILAAKNEEVNNYNSQRYNSLNGKEYVFKAQRTDIFPDSMKLVEEEIHLKVGAQVMLMKNKYNLQTASFEYYNGSIGEILSIDDEKEIIVVALSERGRERKVIVQPVEWENIEFVWDAELKESKTRILGKYRQMPIRLAWAITIHKSQGLTFENVSADLNSCFDVGQVYVALSRCRKLSGLYLKEPIGVDIIKIDPRIVDFSRTETPNTMVLKHLESGKADKKYQSCRMAFEENDAIKMLLEFDAAMKIRDDSQSDIFRKYIRVKLALYHRYKDKCLFFGKKVEKAVSDLQVAYKKIEISNQEKEELLVEKSNQNNIIIALQNRIQTLDQNFDSACKEINELKRDVNLWQTLHGVQKNNVSKLEYERDNLKKEIKRLGNITWLQKLFGKK